MANIGTGEVLPENIQGQSDADGITVLLGGNYFFDEKSIYKMVSLLGGLKTSQLVTD